MMSDDSLIDCTIDVRSIFLWFRDGDFWKLEYLFGNVGC